MTRSLLANRITRRAKEAGGLRALARSINTDPGYLSKLRKGKKNPSDTLLEKLGLERVEYYVSTTDEPDDV